MAISNTDRYRLHETDAHGLAEGQTRWNKVVGASEPTRAIVTQGDSSAWVTMIESGAPLADA